MKPAIPSPPNSRIQNQDMPAMKNIPPQTAAVSMV
jgi:hypothetical protein